MDPPDPEQAWGTGRKEGKICLYTCQSAAVCGIMSVKQTLYHRASGFCVHRRKPGAQFPRRDTMSGGHGIMSAKQTLYHRASGFRVHRENPGAQISRRGTMSGGHGIMSAKQTLYHGASGFRVHRENPGAQISRQGYHVRRTWYNDAGRPEGQNRRS